MSGEILPLPIMSGEILPLPTEVYLMIVGVTQAEHVLLVITWLLPSYHVTGIEYQTMSVIINLLPSLAKVLYGKHCEHYFHEIPHQYSYDNWSLICCKSGIINIYKTFTIVLRISVNIFQRCVIQQLGSTKIIIWYCHRKNELISSGLGCKLLYWYICG